MSQPWASGPREILEHGVALLRKDTEKYRRLALLSIDNAVELTIKTYLGLPKRVTGLKLSRGKYLEISQSFPALLDALEEHGPDKLAGVDLGEIEWYHRLRNELYHQGNGLNVDREKVQVYAELAKILFRNLFGIEVGEETPSSGSKLQRFLSAWAAIEKTSYVILSHLEPTSQKSGTTPTLRTLGSLQVIEPSMAKELDQLRMIRNRVVHGDTETIDELSETQLSRVEWVAETLKTFVRNSIEKGTEGLTSKKKPAE